MNFTRCGLDIAKRVFQVHGVNEQGVVQARRNLPRGKVLGFFAQLPPCLIGIEACGAAHYWARALGKLGHTVKIMAAQFVIPYRRSGKNDANDAEAICEAVGRPNMHLGTPHGISSNPAAGSCPGVKRIFPYKVEEDYPPGIARA
jgi:transposase